MSPNLRKLRVMTFFFLLINHLLFVSQPPPVGPSKVQGPGQLPLLPPALDIGLWATWGTSLQGWNTIKIVIKFQKIHSHFELPKFEMVWLHYDCVHQVQDRWHRQSHYRYIYSRHVYWNCIRTPWGGRYLRFCSIHTTPPNKYESKTYFFESLWNFSFISLYTFRNQATQRGWTLLFVMHTHFYDYFSAYIIL